MCCIRGFKGEWKIISKDKALEYGKNRLKDLGLSVHHIPRQNDLKEFEIYE